MASNKKKCFVIMPFSDTESCPEQKWTEIFEHIIKPAVEECGFGYECRRYKLGRANVVKDILEELDRAQLVIADLTDNNANVLWELGVRHTLRRRTILIAQDKKFLPSDLKDYPLIPYDQTKAGFDKFKKDIKDKLSDIEANPEKSDSPVADFLGLKNIDLLDYEKSANLKKLDALLSELSFDVEATDRISKDISNSYLPLDRLETTCMRLIYSTRYINLSIELTSMLSDAMRIIDQINSMLDLRDQHVISAEQIKKLAKSLPGMKDTLTGYLKIFAGLRAVFANDNYQEPKEPVIVLTNPEHEKLFKL